MFELNELQEAQQLGVNQIFSVVAGENDFEPNELLNQIKYLVPFYNSDMHYLIEQTSPMFSLSNGIIYRRAELNKLMNRDLAQMTEWLSKKTFLQKAFNYHPSR